MSGIMGFYYLDGRVGDRASLEQMLERLAHRGMDRSGLWCEESVGLGHRLLWTTPESLIETQPWVNDAATLAITADARIDNREELMPRLGFANPASAPPTDSQLILAAYATWGNQCLEHLLGDFAFAIWDKHQRTLFCACDPMGVKPLFYYHSAHLFVFASEISALFCLPEVPRRLDEIKVAYHLNAFFEDQERTFYQEIKQLLPAHGLTVHRGGAVRSFRYWELNPSRELQFSSQEEYTEGFIDVFTKAVQCRLRSAFPVGSSLSGGLDSSSIACTARNLLEQTRDAKLHTFSAIFPNLSEEERRWIDERFYMNAVKAQGGLIAHDVLADQLSPLIHLLWQGEEAILATNLYLHQALYQCAHQHGVRVFLDGLDGDVTVGHGWARLAELTYTGHWRTLWREVHATARRHHAQPVHIFWQHALMPLMTAPLQYVQQRCPAGMGRWNTLSPLVNRAFANRVGLVERLHTAGQRHPSLVLNTRQYQWLGLTSGLYTHVLTMADRATARYSIEGRYPFFDRRLMEFCLALPSSQKLRWGWTRAILRSAMTDILPREVQWRWSKGNLSPNFRRRLLEAEHETLERVIRHPQAIAPYVNVEILRSAYERYAAQPQDQSSDAITVMTGVILALWLEQSTLTT